MEGDDDGLLLNFVTSGGGAATGKRKSSKTRYAERHGKAAKKRRVQASGSGGQREGPLGQVGGKETPVTLPAEQHSKGGKREESTVGHDSEYQKPAWAASKRADQTRFGGIKQIAGSLEAPVEQAVKAASRANFQSKKTAGPTNQASVKSGNGSGSSGHAGGQVRREQNVRAGAKPFANSGAAQEVKPQLLHQATNAAATNAVDAKPAKSEPLSAEAARSVFSASSFAELGLSAQVAQHIEGGFEAHAER